MAKIYLYSLKHAKKDLNYTSNMDGKLNLDDDIQRMLNTIFKEEELLDKMNENDNGNDLNENQSKELIMTDERLDIESTVDLELWVFINNSDLHTDQIRSGQMGRSGQFS